MTGSEKGYVVVIKASKHPTDTTLNYTRSMLPWKRIFQGLKCTYEVQKTNNSTLGSWLGQHLRGEMSFLCVYDQN